MSRPGSTCSGGGRRGIATRDDNGNGNNSNGERADGECADGKRIGIVSISIDISISIVGRAITSQDRTGEDDGRRDRTCDACSECGARCVVR